jgi:dTDP-4-amino-4,6-dideoxygalactose transaminase
MSEYHAAVGLAELDGWSEKRAALRRVAESYRRSAAHGGLTIPVAPQVSSCYALLSSPDGLRAGAALTHEGIDHRLWYGRGLHREPYFATDYSLPVVDTLASRLIGLPVAPDLPDAVIERIVAILAGGRA